MENVQRNSLGPRVKVLTTLKDGPLLPLNLFQIERYLIAIFEADLKTRFLHVQSAFL
jgi:hypothetical protein